MIPFFHPAAEQELAAAMRIGEERGPGTIDPIEQTKRKSATAKSGLRNRTAIDARGKNSLSATRR
jgi:hypothetical protein